MDHSKQLHQDRTSFRSGVVVSDRQSHDSQSLPQNSKMKAIYFLSLVLAGLCACASMAASLSQPIAHQHGPLDDLLFLPPNSKKAKEDYKAAKSGKGNKWKWKRNKAKSAAGGGGRKMIRSDTRGQEKVDAKKKWGNGKKNKQGGQMKLLQTRKKGNAKTTEQKTKKYQLMNSGESVVSLGGNQDGTNGQSPRNLTKGGVSSKGTNQWSSAGYKNNQVDQRHGGDTKETILNTNMSVNADDVDFTLVTHFSLDRIMVMKQHCGRWKHRMSIAIGSRRSTTAIAKALGALGCNMDLITFGTIPYTPPNYNGHFEVYPVQELWALAMATVQTSHSVVVETGFVLPENAYDNFVEQRHVLANDDTTALLIPAFELQPSCPKSTDIGEQVLPDTKDRLLSLIDKEKLPDGYDNNWYNEWSIQDGQSPQQIDSFTSTLAEPTLVLETETVLSVVSNDGVPSTDNQNKATRFQQLQPHGYDKVLQLSGVFAVRFHQPPSAADMKKKKKKKIAKWKKPKTDKENCTGNR